MKKALGQLGLASIPSFIQRLLLNTGAHWPLSRDPGPQIAKSDGTGCKVMTAVVQDSGETGLSDFGSLKGMWNKGCKGNDGETALSDFGYLKGMWNEGRKRNDVLIVPSWGIQRLSASILCPRRVPVPCQEL